MTGAADALAPFAAAGRRAHLVVGREVPDVDVLAVSTASRAGAESEARAGVGRAVRSLRERGVGRFYKKVDSTLRGHVGAEVGTLLDVLGTSVLGVVCPAFPAMGRTVRDGRLLLDGRPIDRDARASVTREAQAATGRLEGLFAELGPITPVRLEVVRAGPRAVASVLQHAPRVAIVDAAETDDLAVVAAACRMLERGYVGVGSGGFAAALAGPAQVGLPALACDRVLVVVGSLHARSRAQLAHLVERPDVALVELDVGGLHGATAADGSLLSAERAVTVVSTPPSPGTSAPHDVARTLGELVHRSAVEEVCGLVVTGGDLAAAVLSSTRTAGVTMFGEVAPGLPVGRLVGGTFAGALLITKSGGFGAPDLLATAVEAFRATSQEDHG